MHPSHYRIFQIYINHEAVWIFINIGGDTEIIYCIALRRMYDWP